MTVIDSITLASVTHPTELLHHGSDLQNHLLASYATTVRTRYYLHRKGYRSDHIRTRLSTLYNSLVDPGKQSLKWVTGRNHHFQCLLLALVWCLWST